MGQCRLRGVAGNALGVGRQPQPKLGVIGNVPQPGLAESYSHPFWLTNLGVTLWDNATRIIQFEENIYRWLKRDEGSLVRLPSGRWYIYARAGILYVPRVFSQIQGLPGTTSSLLWTERFRYGLSTACGVEFLSPGKVVNPPAAAKPWLGLICRRSRV